MRNEQREEGGGVGQAALESGSNMAREYAKHAGKNASSSATKGVGNAAANSAGSAAANSAGSAAASSAGSVAGGATAGTAASPGIGTLIGLIVGVVIEIIKNPERFFFTLLVIVASVALVFNVITSADIATAVIQTLSTTSSDYYSNTVPLSDEVLAYEDAVRAEAEKYGTEDYTQLFLAVMMQESGGTAIDVFQCAESLGYGPQGKTGTDITTEQSITQGVKILSNYIFVAGVTGPTDIAHIKLALQAYNMGGGFIEYANQNHGGYTLEAAFDYQELRSGGTKRSVGADVLGPYAYGDANYADHVLAYYSTGGYQNAHSSIPSYYQQDYAHVKFGDGTIASSGCGLTSFAMVATYITGTVITPEDAVAWCGDTYYTDVGLAWSYFQAATSYFGLNVKVTYTMDSGKVLEALKDGKAVISSQKPGLFTTQGHFIVLSGINEEGKVFVNDPNKSNAVGKGYNGRAFDFETEIHATSKGYWIWG